MAFFQCGDSRLYVGEAEPGRDVSHPLLYFSVDDIDEAHRDFEGRGVLFEGPPHIVHVDEPAQLWLRSFASLTARARVDGRTRSPRR